MNTMWVSVYLISGYANPAPNEKPRQNTRMAACGTVYGFHNGYLITTHVVINAHIKVNVWFLLYTNLHKTTRLWRKCTLSHRQNMNMCLTPHDLNIQCQLNTMCTFSWFNRFFFFNYHKQLHSHSTPGSLHWVWLVLHNISLNLKP